LTGPTAADTAGHLPRVASMSGNKCRICHKAEARHKVREVIPNHEAASRDFVCSARLCCQCFRYVMGAVRCCKGVR